MCCAQRAIPRRNREVKGREERESCVSVYVVIYQVRDRSQFPRRNRRFVDEGLYRTLRTFFRGRRRRRRRPERFSVSRTFSVTSSLSSPLLYRALHFWYELSA